MRARSQPSGGPVADAAVTDTNALLYHASGPSRMLGRQAARHLQDCDAGRVLTYVPTGVIWELAMLARVGRADLGRSVRQFFDDLFSKPSYQPLDVSPEQVYDASELGFNRDPFDGLIVAAARSLNLPLITRDEAIRTSGAVRVLW